MAKGNLFLGMGRGSVGDVVLYRANGQQLSRARNRAPRNPRSDAQLVQRAVSATIAQAYKAGKAIFDHAFEGKQVPSGNQRRFISVNMRKLRAAVVPELNYTDAQECSGRVVSRSAAYPIPWSYRISEGSLVQNLFSVVGMTPVEETDPVIGIKMADALTDETVAGYAARFNLTEGEIFTVCVFGVIPPISDPEELNGLKVSQQSVFGFARYTVKGGLAEVTKAMSAATYGDFFTLDSTGGGNLSTLCSAAQGMNEFAFNMAPTGSIGVIRSNENSGLRSTTDMSTPFVLNTGNDLWGVPSSELLNAWSDETSGVDSPLILEGGDI